MTSGVSVQTTVRAWIDRLSLERLAAVLLFVAITVIACLMPVQSDTWWQLRAGQEFWSSGAVPLEETYSHTASGRVWMNHEWLSEVLFYGVYAIGGLPLLTALAALASTATVALLWSLMTGPTLLRLALTGASVGTMSIAWTPRPHVFTLLLLAVCAKLLVAGRYRWLPPLFLLWANLHGGFTLGLALVGTSLVAAAPQGRKVMQRRLVVLAACLVATFITPLGVGFWLELPASLSRLREYAVLEWQRASLLDGALLPFWITVGALLFLLARRWRTVWSSETDRVLAVGAVAFIPLALNSIRNVPPFLILALPAITRALDLRPAQSVDDPLPSARARLHAIVLGAGVTVAVAVVAMAWLAPWSRLQWNPLPPPVVDAIDSCQGPLYNSYDDGGFLIWFVPHRKVFIDSRQDPYPIELVQQDMRAQLAGEYRQVFAEFGVRCALLRSGSLLEARLAEDGWRPLHRDAAWVIFAQEEPVR